MISVHTAPGTRVRCIKTTSGIGPNVVAGSVYTVAGWRMNDNGQPGVLLAECDHGRVDVSSVWDRLRGRKDWVFISFNPALFVRLDLPRSITEALTSQPLIPDHEREVAAA